MFVPIRRSPENLKNTNKNQTGHLFQSLLLLRERRISLLFNCQTSAGKSFFMLIFHLVKSGRAEHTTIKCGGQAAVGGIPGLSHQALRSEEKCLSADDTDGAD